MNSRLGRHKEIPIQTHHNKSVEKTKTKALKQQEKHVQTFKELIVSFTISSQNRRARNTAQLCYMRLLLL